MSNEKQQNHQQGGAPVVEVVYLNTNEDAKFHEAWSLIATGRGL